MTIAIFSSLPLRPQLGDKVYTTDDPATVSTRRRRGSLLVGRVIEYGDCPDEVIVAMRRLGTITIPPP
jgi:hypothetical protein